MGRGPWAGYGGLLFPDSDGALDPVLYAAMARAHPTAVNGTRTPHRRKRRAHTPPPSTARAHPTAVNGTRPPHRRQRRAPNPPPPV